MLFRSPKISKKLQPLEFNRREIETTGSIGYYRVSGYTEGKQDQLTDLTSVGLTSKIQWDSYKAKAQFRYSQNIDQLRPETSIHRVSLANVEVEDRRKIQQLMEKQNNIVCVAISKIFSTGISIKNIHYIMFAAGGKSKIKTLQSIGRGLRIHENKDILTLLDIVDNLVYGKKHFEKRKQFYDLEKIQVKTKDVSES